MMMSIFAQQADWSKKRMHGSSRHPERSEGSPCDGITFKVVIDTNRSMQDSMH